MELIIPIILLILSILVFVFVFKINIKKAKEIESNKEMETITDKFPDNKKIAEEILNLLDNKTVKIEEAKDTKTSLYIAPTNKIIIADMRNNYGRIQTIAHECIHSCQDKRLLMGNFILSNLYIIYYIITIFLTIFKIYENTHLHLFILSIFSFVVFGIRAFLEIDAMTKSRFLAEKYIDKKEICTLEEKEVLLKSYDMINEIGIPFVINSLFFSSILKLIIYLVIAAIF